MRLDCDYAWLKYGAILSNLIDPLRLPQSLRPSGFENVFVSILKVRLTKFA